MKKWRKRRMSGAPNDPRLLCSRSRAHHAPYFRWDPRVETRMVDMRLSPPEHLGRTPGPRALLYDLPRDRELQALQVRLPRSSRTIWKILHRHGCIWSQKKKQKPLEPREPLEEIQMDFKDVSSVLPAQSLEGKHKHVVEVCNAGGCGNFHRVMGASQGRFPGTHRHGDGDHFLTNVRMPTPDDL